VKQDGFEEEMMKLSENLWPEDLELSVPAVHDAARSPQNPLLLLVEVGTDFVHRLWPFSVKSSNREEYWRRIALPELQC
jgi:hypothetical protein